MESADHTEESEQHQSTVKENVEDALQTHPNTIPDEKPKTEPVPYTGTSEVKSLSEGSGNTTDKQLSSPRTSSMKKDEEKPVTIESHGSLSNTSEVKSDDTSNRPPPSRTPSVTNAEEIKDAIIEQLVGTELMTNEKKNTAEVEVLLNAIPTAMSVDNTETSSSRTSSMTTINEPVKQMTVRQKATVLVLCFINLLKYMDRFTIAGILTDIQCDFGINDAQGGLLSTAFIVSYMLFSPVFGYLGDRFSRKLIMGIGISFWSLSTLAGSFTQTYGVFLTSRIMVGIGEAMFSTVSPTIISDVCVGDTRSNYLILYYFAIPVGSGLGFIVGAVMASAFGSWQWGLRVTPILGAIAVLLLIFVVREPPRGEAEGSTLSATTYWDDLKYLGKNKSYVLSTAGCTLVTYVSGALAWWGPKFVTLGLATTQGVAVSYARVSVVVGFEAALAGVLGVASGSLVGQKLRKRFPTADALVCAWSMIICAPLLYWGIAIADGPAIPTYIVLFFGQWFMNINWALIGDILLYVVIPTRRSTAEAFSILISHALGDAGSPYIVGLISDSFRESLMEKATAPRTLTHGFYDGPMLLEESADDCSGSSFINPDTVVIDFTALQYSFFLTTIIAGLSSLFFFANAWYIVEDKAKVDKSVKEHDQTKRLEKLKQQASLDTKVKIDVAADSVTSSTSSGLLKKDAPASTEMIHN